VADPSCDYALGSTAAEQERLIRQSSYLEPITERLFREAGIAAGQRVLDLGSGVGDVSMLAAKLVGPSGEVVGIEREATSIARARARAAAAGLRNVSFLQSDAAEISLKKPFDAAVGRFVLQFIPDAANVLRSVAQLVRPGGVVAFNEPQWGPWLTMLEPLPLAHACALPIREAFHRSAVVSDMGASLHRLFQDAGLPPPTMRMEMLLGAEPLYAHWLFDLLVTVQPRIASLGISLEKLGDLSSLAERLQAEMARARTVMPLIALVGAWSRKPEVAEYGTGVIFPS
jgi:SAM-dependent methyltransferase